jgi:hypothetical protein
MSHLWAKVVIRIDAFSKGAVREAQLVRFTSFTEVKVSGIVIGHLIE